ncbi:hypothetical protein [Halorubrum sp. Ib24]|uniref:hypothetical protein n=1 Tax=Halorubrum sp. Ib24 TaxID=1383850 RepID=UPI001F537AD6|nr:hypothetical protein [Halorubrum sp. Ib24]
MSREVISHTDGHVYEFARTMEPVTRRRRGVRSRRDHRHLNGEIQSDDDLLDAIPEEVNAATGSDRPSRGGPATFARVKIGGRARRRDRGRSSRRPGSASLQDDPGIEHPGGTADHLNVAARAPERAALAAGATALAAGGRWRRERRGRRRETRIEFEDRRR